jgi:cell division protease FtsH
MKKFEEIIGYETEKEELIRLCDIMKNKEKYSMLGVEMPKAILLHGEPGVGKTLMAETLIEESGRKCFSCKKDRSDGAFVDKIRETFENATNNQPSIVFLDDMDKFAQDNLREDNNKEEFVTIANVQELLKKEVIGVIPESDNIVYGNAIGRTLYGVKECFSLLADNIHTGSIKLYDCTQPYRGFLGAIKRSIKRRV